MALIKDSHRFLWSYTIIIHILPHTQGWSSPSTCRATTQPRRSTGESFSLISLFTLWIRSLPLQLMNNAKYCECWNWDVMICWNIDSAIHSLFNLYLNIIDDVSKQTSTSTLLSTSTSTSIFPTTASFNLYLNINTYCQHQHQTGNQHVIITINIKINNQHDQGRAGWGQCSTPGKQAGHLHEQGGTHASTGEDDGHGGDGDLYIMMKCLFVCHEKW